MAAETGRPETMDGRVTEKKKLFCNPAIFFD